MTYYTEKSQVLKLFLILLLLTITPLLSSSHRSAYLYFIANVLIIVVGAEAGLLSFFLEPPENNKRRPNHALKPTVTSINSAFPPDKARTAAQLDTYGTNSVVEKRTENNVGESKKVKKSPSTPSIFFIGDQSEDQMVEEKKNEEVGEEVGEELFQKAETFIGNFYKQLKMQREESWKKLHDLYQKAF
ncbi:hypothetical protein Salat_0311500 [Sesamum alatum]|uniref:DUF4408 domain-containing protein n=1 Tax=Sesamum alatum TaxID=300844 RepID=A0AAE1Z0K1_9LAMI|nr:hypothetical protein Salat_0311500 [Sesamum alatum]